MRYIEGRELIQYHAVIDCYRRHIARSHEVGALPNQFKTEDVDVGTFGVSWLFSSKRKRILYQYNANSFYISFWKLPPATIIPIRNALNAICSYQLSRHQRKVGGGHLYDMTNLVCEQLKEWLLHMASRDLMDSDRIKLDINSHIAYIKSLEKNNIFPSGLKHDITMNATLIEVSDCLDKTIDEIDMIFQKRSLRDIISQVTRHTENVVDGTLQYLFYVFRSNKTPAAINMQRLSFVELYAYKSIRDTRSFRLLQTLLQSPYVKQVNRQEFTAFDQHKVFVTHLNHFHIKKNMGSGLDLTSDAAREDSHLNAVIGGNLIPDRHIIRRWWGNVHSGIDYFFQNKYAVLEAFVKLHGIVERLSFFSIICRQMEEMVDYFGMMIWASFGEKILCYFKEAFKRLNNDYRSCCQQIHHVASHRYNSLVQNNKRTSHWCANFNHADRLFDSMMLNMEHAFSSVSSIPKVIDHFRQHAPQHEVQQRLTYFINQINGFGALFQMQPLEYAVSEEGGSATLMIISP